MQHVFRFLGPVFLVACSVLSSFAQLQVTFPVSRAVFQRGTNGRGTFSIAGSYYQAVDQIQARVTPIQGGTATDWVTIQTNPQGGNFLGSFTANGGWYRLEVRAVRGGNQIGNSATVDRVGVGEVFILSGQSNAQGIDNPIPSGQIEPEDRVNTVNYDNSLSHSLNDPPFPNITKMPSGVYYSLRGVGSWAWGWLGNQIANRFNVPVLFINTAFAGTDIESWRASANGERATNIFCRECPGDDKFYPVGMPYGNLKLGLQYYASLFGVRSVLWMQGETDNTPLGTSSDEYKGKLKYVIEKSRNDTGKELTWVVSQTSHHQCPIPGCSGNAEYVSRTQHRRNSGTPPRRRYALPARPRPRYGQKRPPNAGRGLEQRPQRRVFCEFPPSAISGPRADGHFLRGQ